MLDENVSPAADQPDSWAVGQPLVTPSPAGPPYKSAQRETHLLLKDDACLLLLSEWDTLLALHQPHGSSSEVHILPRQVLMERLHIDKVSTQSDSLAVPSVTQSQAGTDWAYSTHPRI
eukprot:1161342-Pelagomonas_calceolata.AAC.12